MAGRVQIDTLPLNTMSPYAAKATEKSHPLLVAYRSLVCTCVICATSQYKSLNTITRGGEEYQLQLPTAATSKSPPMLDQQHTGISLFLFAAKKLSTAKGRKGLQSNIMPLSELTAPRTHASHSVREISVKVYDKLLVLEPIDIVNHIVLTQCYNIAQQLEFGNLRILLRK